MSATIRDVARLAGVSIATISRYLNNPAVVQAETAARVEAAMTELAYVPQHSARNLSLQSTRTLGLVSEYLDGDFFLPLLTGMETAAYEAGYTLVVSSTRHWKHRTDRMLPIGPQTCDGILVFPGSLALDRLVQWDRAGFPMVLVQHEYAELPTVPRIHIENRSASAAAFKHLYEGHGCRRLVYLAGPPDHYDAARRLEGYHDASAAAGLVPDAAYTLAGGFSEHQARRAMEDFLASGREFDGVLAADDDSALGALEALRVRAPARKVPVMGFDGTLLGTRSNPPLSTVVAPTEEVGAAAVHALIARIRGEEGPLSTTLPCIPRFRGSCGCPCT